MNALLFWIWALFGAVQLLPDGYPRTCEGLGGTLDAGISREEGSVSNLNGLSIRGGFAYQPWLDVSAMLDVDATLPADSTVLSRSRIFLTFGFLPKTDSVGAIPVLSVSVAGWYQSVHFDKQSESFDHHFYGSGISVLAGLGGVSFWHFQAAGGAVGGLEITHSGPSQGISPYVGTDVSLMLDLQRHWPGAKSICRGMGIYAYFPFRWNFSPLDPASGTGLPSLASRWSLGIRAGISGAF